MLDVVARILHHPIDYLGVFRVTNLTLQEKIDEGGGIYSFIFTAPNLPDWKAGQHSLFTLPGKNSQGSPGVLSLLPQHHTKKLLG